MAVTDDYILGLLECVMDPEVPVLSILDLGIVREINADKKTIVITPTYSGCPAMQTIEDDIQI
ncbi:MAG: iron-sulfur cluster assembly protein, partial [Flavobacteriales bacterium]|nr:iron-sulfur cluster assembly protein [Flavobacteriales bacterium]